MANRNGAYGLMPSQHGAGGTPQRMGAYSIASEYAANIFQGDPVKMAATPNGVDIELAAAGAVPVGVFAGCSYVDATGRPHFSKMWPTGLVATDVVAYVYDDPKQTFSIQATTAAIGNIGQYADWEAPNGDVSVGLSRTELDGATFSGTLTGVQVVNLVPSPDNEYGAYAKLNVVFAEHHFTN